MTAQTETTPEPTVRRVLQRIVFPADRDLDVMPLYVDYSAGMLMMGESKSKRPSKETAAPAVDAMQATRRPENILGRHRMRIAADQRASFGTYFNGFAASYWRMWSVLSEVVLRVRVRGDAAVIVYRSTSDGRSQRVDSVSTDEDPSGDFAFTLPLKPFADGGWYWFDIFAGGDDAILEEAAWCADVPADRARQGTATIGITTYNRPDSCAELLEQIAGDKDVVERLDELIVVDQGNKKVAHEPLYADVSAALGDKLRIIDQGNIGGSGGFARAQYETAKAANSDYVLLLDDDIVAETESILRSLVFADLCTHPTIVGGHMFSLYKRSQLHSFGEKVNLYHFWWGPAPHVHPEHDFAVHGLRSTGWMHRRIDVDFNGWWMCLIPRTVIDEIGLGLPLFIKWDDSEYGIRAQEAGFRTVSMPGVAVWHVPWTDKNDALDWQAYYHQRNRTVAALLHSPYDRSGSLIRQSFRHQIKHLLSMQYSTAELRLDALEDVLRGPDHLHPEIATKLPEVRAKRARHTDAQMAPHPDRFPRVHLRKPPKRGRDAGDIGGRFGKVMAAGMSGIKQFMPRRPESEFNPEAHIAASDTQWWRLAQFDSAVVSTTDGTSASWYKRDRDKFKELLARTVTLHERMHREWPQLVRRYRAAMDDLTGWEAWEKTFAESEAMATPSFPADEASISVDGATGPPGASAVDQPAAERANGDNAVAGEASAEHVGADSAALQTSGGGTESDESASPST